MKYQEYIEEVREAAVSSINEGNYDGSFSASRIISDMVSDDSITGYPSGSYFCDYNRAAREASELVFDEAFISDLIDCGYSMPEVFERGPEWVDVTARCLALYHAEDAVRDAYNRRHDPYAWEWRVCLATDADTATPEKTPYLLTAYFTDSVDIAYQAFCSSLDEVADEYLNFIYSYYPID